MCSSLMYCSAFTFQHFPHYLDLAFCLAALPPCPLFHPPSLFPGSARFLKHTLQAAIFKPILPHGALTLALEARAVSHCSNVSRDSGK